MPLVDITNPDVIKFLIENYDRTTRLRMKWNVLNAEKLKCTAAMPADEKGYFEEDVIKEEQSLGMNTLTREFISSGIYRRRKPIRDCTHVPAIADLKKDFSIPKVELGSVQEDPRLGRPDTDLSFDPIMRPVDPTEKSILHKSKPEYGRKVYLNKRNKKIPEKKYYFTEVTGWQYGWRLKDSYLKNAPEFGRVWRLSRNTKSRTGPHPDPSYYKSSDVPGPAKCMLN